MSDITLTDEQGLVLKKALTWFKDKESKVLTIGGYAGTGKTTLLKFLAKELKEKELSFMSYTGKAAAVMRSKLANQAISTIHSFMYKPVIDENGVISDWIKKDMQYDTDYYFDPSNMAPYADLIIIDEASMVPENLFEDLLSYGKPILAIGDHGQLPPVEGSFSLMSKPDLTLEKIHRQAESNPIIQLATAIRNQDSKWRTFSSVQRKLSFSDSEAEELVSNPSSETLFITGTNRERTQFNKMILLHLNGSLPKKPKPGDRLICLKNNHNLGLYNGMMCEVVEEKKASEYPEHNWGYIIKPDDSNLKIFVNINQYSFFGGKPPVPEKANFYEIKEYFDYAYALTCHKAQGSEANNVVVWGTGFGKDYDFRKRWLYTAVTRAKEKLWIFI